MYVADTDTEVLEDSLSHKETAGSSWEGVSLNVTLAWPSKSLLESHEVVLAANPVTALYPQPVVVCVLRSSFLCTVDNT